jgi:hypothetical protein
MKAIFRNFSATVLSIPCCARHPEVRALDNVHVLHIARLVVGGLHQIVLLALIASQAVGANFRVVVERMLQRKTRAPDQNVPQGCPQAR